MGWSLRIANIAGVAMRIHVTFFLLIAWVGFIGWQRAGTAGALDGVAFVTLVFLCVTLHEFGHVFAARHYGVRTRDVTLYPIGGVARLERFPKKPIHEFVIAVAGPLVNVAIAIVLIVMTRTGIAPGALDVTSGEASLASRLIAVNIALVVFNLIPDFPLDGGRMLRALLALRFERVRATGYAARTGQGFGILFGLAGLFGNPFLALIGVFVFLAAGAEYKHERDSAAARGRVAADAMVTKFEALRPTARAEDVGRLLVETTQHEFPVIDENGVCVGVVVRPRLIGVLQQFGPSVPVRTFMDTGFVRAGLREPLDKVVEQLGTAILPFVIVEDPAGRLMGYISIENAEELFAVATAGKARPKQ
ncbi:MAG: site-2 protease family protein [Pseudomonadota bacterium]